MRPQVVQHDYVARSQTRTQDVFAVGVKDERVNAALNRHRCLNARRSECADHRSRSPVIARRGFRFSGCRRPLWHTGASKWSSLPPRPEIATAPRAANVSFAANATPASAGFFHARPLIFFTPQIQCPQFARERRRRCRHLMLARPTARALLQA